MLRTILFICLLSPIFLKAQQAASETAQLIDVETFSALRTGKGIHVVMTMGETNSVAVEGNVTHVKYRCHGRQLRLNRCWWSDDVTVYITCMEMRKIRVGYASSVQCTNMQGNDLEIILDEHAKLNFTGSTDILRVVNRNGSITVSDNYQLGQQLLDYKGQLTDIYFSDQLTDNK